MKETAEPAISIPKFPSFPKIDASPSVTGNIVSWVKYINGWKRSFQLEINEKVPTVATTGIDRGKIILKNT